MNQIVPGGEYHQRQHQGQSETKTVFLRTMTERASPYGFSGIKQKMSTVKHRNWEKVYQSKVYRQYRHEGNDSRETVLRDLTRHLCNTQRASELIGRTRADDHLPHRLQRAADDIEGLAIGADQGFEGVVADVLHALPHDFPASRIDACCRNGR